jgi:hypothetical protein
MYFLIEIQQYFLPENSLYTLERVSLLGELISLKNLPHTESKETVIFFG